MSIFLSTIKNSLYSVLLTLSFIALLLLGGSQWVSHYPAEAKLPMPDTQLFSRAALRLFFGMSPEPGAAYSHASIFYASLFTLTQSFSTITLFPGVWLLFILISTFFLSTHHERLVAIGIVATLISLYIPILSPLPWGSYRPETLSFVLILAAVVLFWQGCKQADNPNWPSLILSLLLLGAATALQGLTLFSGFFWIVCFWGRWLRSPPPIKPVLLLLTLLGSLVVIPVSQIAHTYADPADPRFVLLGSLITPPHHWTLANEQTLLQKIHGDQSLTPRQLYQQYLSFISSVFGLTIILTALIQQLNQDIVAAQQPLFLGLCLLCYGFSQLVSLRRGHIKTRPWLFHTALMLLLLLVVFSPLPQHHPTTTLPLLTLIILLLVTLHQRIILVCLLLGLYLSALLIWILLGSAGGEAVIATYRFALYLALVLWMLQPILSSTDYPPNSALPLSVVAGVQAILLCFLYFGVYWLPQPLKMAFNQPQLSANNLVIKIAENRTIDRSLYFNQRGQLFLTRTDILPFQVPIHYQQLITHPAPAFMQQPGFTPDEQFYVASFYQPFGLVHSLSNYISPVKIDSN